MKTRLALLALYPLLMFGLVLTAVRYLVAVAMAPTKAWKIALMIDEMGNVDANGRVNQTISARAALARNANRKWGCVLCWILGKIDTNHCDKALEP